MSPPIIQINGMVCAICDAKNGVMRWTDTHGIAACIQCGAPYQILFYDGEGRDRVRIDHDPELLILPAWRELAVRYWQETGRNVAPGMLHTPGSSYEVASRDDWQALKTWFNAHESELPVVEEVTA